jgi:PAS domain S-box-containing protein
VDREHREHPGAEPATPHFPGRDGTEVTPHTVAQILRAIARYAPLAIIVTDLEGRVSLWNPAAERLFGWSAAEVLGRGNPIVPQEKGEEYRRLQESVRDGSPYHSRELQRQRRDGSRIRLNASSAALHDRQGAVIGLLGIFEDVTERRAAEEALRENEARFRAAFENAAVGASIVDLSGRFLRVNRFLCRLTGYAEEELRSKTFSEITHPEDVHIGLDALRRQLAGEEEFASFEKRYLRKDGGVVHMIVSPTLIRDAAGAPSSFVSLFQDVSERKAAEEKLGRSEEFVRTILDSVDEGFILIDRNYRVLTANKAFCAQSGLPCDEVIGLPCDDVARGARRPCAREDAECAGRRAFATAEPATSIRRCENGHDTPRYFERRAFPVLNDAGAVATVIETVRDITEKRLLEEERLKTQKLEAIGTLAGGIAHDFNNLLQGVFGHISLAKMELAPGTPAHEMLSQAEEALHLSVNLTTQLLTFSKGGKPIRRRTALHTVIESSAKFALSGSRTGCRVSLAEDLRPAEVDEGQIGQVIQNIVLNADQAMAPGGTVEIAARNARAPSKALPPALAPGDYVVITVRDHGAGMPPKVLERIFDPYFTTKEKGSGLGLATSYSIVRNHGGLIDVASEVGRGSLFCVYLPAAEGVERRPDPAPEAAPRAPARAGRVLVMDDERVVRTIVGKLLASIGHRAEFAQNGEEAIERFRAAGAAGDPFDAVILDLTVRGGLGGRETLERLLAIDPGVRAVVSSGYSEDAVMADHRAHGFRARLTKPYRLDQLRETLCELLA